MSDSSIDGAPDSKETAAPLHTVGEIVEPSGKPDLPGGQTASARREGEQSFYRPIESTMQVVRHAPPLAVPGIVAMVFIRQARRVSWHKRTGNVDLAAVVIVLALACCTAYSDRVSYPRVDFPDLPKTPAAVQQVSLSPRKPVSLEEHSSSSLRATTAGELRHAKQIHQPRFAAQRIVHIGDDVTVRYFVPAPLPHKTPPNGDQVVHKGNDVTVRYFTPLRPNSKENVRPVAAADRKHLGGTASSSADLRASGSKTSD